MSEDDSPKPERRTESKGKVNFIYELLPQDFMVNQDEFDKTYARITRTMEKYDDIVSLSFVKADGSQPFVIAKSQEYFTNISSIGSIIKELNPREFFEELGDIEYKNLGHLSFERFDLYFARLSNHVAVALQFTDVKLQVFQASDKLIAFIRSTLNFEEIESEIETITESTKKGDVPAETESESIHSNTLTKTKKFSNLEDIRDVIKAKSKNMKG